jgi:hypothetical protein
MTKKGKKTKKQAMIYNTIHRKLKIERHGPHKQRGKLRNGKQYMSLLTLYIMLYPNQFGIYLSPFICALLKYWKISNNTFTSNNTH